MRARNELILREEQQALSSLQQPTPLGLSALPEVPQRSLVKIVLRRFWLVILFAGIGAGLATAYLKRATPLFTSEAKIYITPASGIRILNETLASAQKSNYLYVQCSLITTTPMLKLVMEKPGISDLRTLKRKPDPVFYLQKMLSVEVGRRDDFISISISTPYPDDSAAIVDAVVQTYTESTLKEKRTSLSSVVDALSGTLKTATAERDEKRKEVADFQKSNPTFNFDAVYQGQLGQLLSAYTAAKLATIEARANFGAGHRNVQNAQQREETYYDQWQLAMKDAFKTNKSAAEYQLLNATLQDKEAFVKQLSQRIDELNLAQQTQAQQAGSTIQEVEPARVADEPSYPRRYRVMAVAIGLGGLLGAGLALLRDSSDGRMRSVEEIQGIINLPILGVVPAMSGRRTAVARAMTVHLDPRSVVAEAYRTIRTAIYFGLGGGAGGDLTKTILVTSPEPGDGKTTSASNLAIAIAQTGRSVLLLDADFRKPSQHKNLEIKNAIGLSSVLAGAEPLERAIQRTGVEGLDILPCGPIPANPSEILNSREFGELVDTLASRYDHILFDSPPVNPVTDARILGAVCDATILVLRADKSTRKAGEHARNALMAVGARVLGAIVNDASKRKGYEVYGGSYYGGVDVPMRQPDRKNAESRSNDEYSHLAKAEW